MIEWLQAARDIFYKFLNSTPFILTIGFLSGLLRIQVIRNFFDLNSFFLKYKDWITLLFLFSTIYIFCKIFSWFYKKITGLVLTYKHKNNVLKELDSLNEDEKKIIGWLAFRNEKTISGKIYESALISLVAKNILVRTGANDYHECPHTVNNFVWEKIKIDPRFKKNKTP